MTQREFLKICAHGTAADVRNALRLGADLNEESVIDGMNLTPLLTSMIFSNVSAGHGLIRAGADYIETLMKFVISGQEKYVEFLLTCGANINFQDDKNYSPLLYAVSENNYCAVKLLIEFGADVNLRLGGKFNVLTCIVLMAHEEGKKINSRIIKALMKAKIDYEEAFLLAVKLDNRRFIAQLIKYGADINKKWTLHSPLYVAMLYSEGKINPKMVEFLAKNGADVNEIFDDDEAAVSTPLNISIALNRPDIARILLKYGADANYIDHKSRTPLFYAAVTGNKILRTLLSNGANPNKQDKDGRTPLMLALIDGESDGDIVKSLFEFGADPNIQDNRGTTALMWAIINYDRAPYLMINALIRTGGFRANGWKNWFALTEIYVALKRKIQLTNIKLLLANGADRNIRNREGMTAFTYAATNFDDEISEMLIKAEINTTKEN